MGLDEVHEARRASANPRPPALATAGPGAHVPAGIYLILVLKLLLWISY